MVGSTVAGSPATGAAAGAQSLMSSTELAALEAEMLPGSAARKLEGGLAQADAQPKHAAASFVRLPSHRIMEDDDESGSVASTEDLTARKACTNKNLEDTAAAAPTVPAAADTKADIQALKQGAAVPTSDSARPSGSASWKSCGSTSSSMIGTPGGLRPVRVASVVVRDSKAAPSEMESKPSKSAASSSSPVNSNISPTNSSPTEGKKQTKSALRTGAINSASS